MNWLAVLCTFDKQIFHNFIFLTKKQNLQCPYRGKKNQLKLTHKTYLHNVGELKDFTVLVHRLL